LQSESTLVGLAEAVDAIKAEQPHAMHNTTSWARHQCTPSRTRQLAGSYAGPNLALAPEFIETFRSASRFAEADGRRASCLDDAARNARALCRMIIERFIRSHPDAFFY
jgi:hypothetical protein